MNSSSGDLPSWTDLNFPMGEDKTLRSSYSLSRVILEYGSGGSTFFAAGEPGKLVLSVESDRFWAVRLQRELDTRELPSPAIVHYVDIGPTGDWGRPLSPERWVQFHRYPLSIWDEPFFRQPDVVLIDGRFRPACLMAVMLRTSKRVTVLFDDYTDRPAYHSVEELIRPAEIVGRMAVFEVEPRRFDPSEATLLMNHFFRATYHGQKSGLYDVLPNVASEGPER